jgi:hypothetical protein
MSDSGAVAPQEVKINNLGTSILAWGATTSASWLTLSPPAGVAIGNDVYCLAGNACQRSGTLKIAVNTSALPSGTKRATIRVYTPQTNDTQTITVSIASIGKTGVPGIVRN